MLITKIIEDGTKVLFDIREVNFDKTELMIYTVAKIEKGKRKKFNYGIHMPQLMKVSKLIKLKNYLT